ncbi:MAG: hypothetical protein ACLQVY_10815 [Limisphaerales bacterium]
MTCPICGNVVTFPAIPPKTTAKGLRLDRPAGQAGRKWTWKPRGIFLFLRDFPHWKIIGGVLVPFLIIGGLLEGAGYVKKMFRDDPAVAPAVGVAPVAPGAWQESVDLSLAGQSVEEQMKVVRAWRAAVERAQESRDNTRRQYGGSSSYAASADQALQRAQNNSIAAYNKFRELNATYQKLGGKTDYEAHLSD